MEAATNSWRSLIGSRLPSERRFSSDYAGNNQTVRRRRKPHRHHTIDATVSNVDKQRIMEEPGSPTPSLSPKKSTNGRPSLLQRFLASTARRRSQTPGEGSTVDRMTDDELDQDPSPIPITRRATIDVNPRTTTTTTTTTTSSTTASNSTNTSSTANIEPTTEPVVPPPANGSSPLGLLRRKSGDGSVGGSFGLLRRRSGDGSVTSSAGPLNLLRRRSGDGSKSDLSMSLSGHRRSSRRSLFSSGSDDNLRMTEKDYLSTQARLQNRADDLHKSGQLEKAIEQWVECLELAEEHQDTLTNKTEILCILVDLHLQVARQNLDVYSTEVKSPEQSERDARYHEKTAKRYVHRIKPALVKPQWLSCSEPLMDFFVECEAWELAIVVADQLMQNPAVRLDVQKVATIHFQLAAQQLDTHRQGEALQHLQATVNILQQIPVGKRDMAMFLQVLQLLATEYLSQGQDGLALEAYQEQLKYAAPSQHASLYCQMAQVHINKQQLVLALEQLEASALHLDASEPSIRLQLLQTKGDVFYRLGRMEESLVVYENALEEAVNPADKAKLLYTAGKLCVRLKRIRPAISYFTREMEITQAELGQNHLSVSRVLHELAKLYDDGLGEHKMALMKLQKALQIELAVLQECQYAITQCQKCNPVTHRMCSMHANLQRDVSNQIRETKKAQGRIHFKLGDFERALKTSFQESTKGDGR